MPHISEYEVEARFIERLESLGYTFAPLNNYDDVLANFRLELSKFNAAKLIEAKGQKNTPQVKWSAKAKKTVIEKTFSIVKTGLNSSAVVIQTKNNDKSKNIIKDAEGKAIATMRAATKDEIKSGKRKFTFVIEGSADTLVKNADVSAALVVKAFGKDVDPKDYVVTVANTKNGKTGKITIKPVKGSKTYSGSKSITFMYVKDIKN